MLGKEVAENVAAIMVQVALPVSKLATFVAIKVPAERTIHLVIAGALQERADKIGLARRCLAPTMDAQRIVLDAGQD